MPKVTIDGQEILVEAGTTVIQAAEKLGIYVPRYCYHPGLSIAGSCRMCMVEIEKLPKLAISCHTQVQDGMQVHTDSERAKEARRGMLEFLLSNHPLDCPVCDQAGECDLQNYYMEIGRYDSRFLENKIKRRKAFSVGPHVILDQERCILCSRCVRFTEEISKSHELGIFERGNRSVIDLQPGRQLDNLYSGNVIDICPVGALTEREFRFQCRVWYLSTADSICSGCARGCNIQIHYNADRRYKAGGRRVQRLKPRFNPHVNRWWMCDEGRFGYGFVNEGRLERPHLRSSGRLEPTDWESALAEAARALQGARERLGPESVGVVASPQLSNEELYLVWKLFVDQLGVSAIGFENPWEKPGVEDDLLLRADRNPNSWGARRQGFETPVLELLEQAAQGRLKVLYLFRHDFEEPRALDLLEQAEYVIYQGSNWNETARRAHLLLPAATHMEKEGTFTNFEGRVQHFQAAFLPLADSRQDVEILAEVARRLEVEVPEEVEGLFQARFGRPLDSLPPFGEILEED